MAFPIRGAVLLLMAAAASPVSPVHAQGEQPFLLTLKDEPVLINYSPGSLDRAHHVQQRLELLTKDASKWMSEELHLRVFVLGRTEWGELGFHLPYGIPGRMPGNTLAVPAAGDEGTVALWTRLRGAPPPPLPGRPLRGTMEEASSLALADLLTEVEAARILLALGEVRGETPWVHQLLAHLLARTAFERYEGPRLGEIAGVFHDLGTGVVAPLSLDSYTQGLDLETYLWFESRFHDGARVVMEGSGKNEAKRLLKLARKNRGILTEAALLEECPEVGAWLESSFAPATGSGR